MKNKRRLFLKRLKELKTGINLENLKEVKIEGQDSLKEDKASLILFIKPGYDYKYITINVGKASRKISFAKNMRYIYAPEGFEVVSSSSGDEVTIYYTLL